MPQLFVNASPPNTRVWTSCICVAQQNGVHERDFDRVEQHETAQSCLTAFAPSMNRPAVVMVEAGRAGMVVFPPWWNLDERCPQFHWSAFCADAPSTIVPLQ